MSRHGGPASRAETLAVSPSGKVKFRRQECETCAKETLFQGPKCLSCGVFRKFRNQRGEIVKYDLKSVRGFNLKRSIAIKRYVRSLRADKSAYYRQQAEASRLKFEGQK